MVPEIKSYQCFTDLNLWKETRSFQLFTTFPPEEKFRLSDQLIRASRSIAANIAEGHGRFHFQEQIQFCRQARGSLSETLNHVLTAFDRNYISKEQLDILHRKIEVVL